MIYFRNVEPQSDGESGDLNCNLQCLMRRRWFLMPSCKLRRFLCFHFLPMLLSSAFASHSMGSQTNSQLVPKIAVKENWVTQTLSQLALKEKVGQLVMPAFRASLFAFQQF